MGERLGESWRPQLNSIPSVKVLVIIIISKTFRNNKVNFSAKPVPALTTNHSNCVIPFVWILML